MTRRIAVLLGLAALATVGCTSSVPPPVASTTSAAPTTTTTTTTPPYDPALANCTGLAGQPTAAPYTGPGPHLAQVEQTYPANGAPISAKPQLPDDWDAVMASIQSEGDIRPALYVCVTKIQITGTTPLGHCYYDSDEFPSLEPAPGETSEDTPPDWDLEVFADTQFFTVITAKTGKVLASFSLPGDDTADHSCPGSSEDIGNGTQVGQGIRTQTIVDRIGPLITATVN